MEIPILDLNHCRCSSTREMIAIGVLQMKQAKESMQAMASAFIVLFCMAGFVVLVGMGLCAVAAVALPKDQKSP